jgi:hydrogenase maturation protease
MKPGRVVVIGYGNDLHGDDGVGQEVAKALYSGRDSAPAVTPAGFFWSPQLLPEMALELSGSSFAVFVDAAYDGNPPGSVKVHRLDPEGTAGDGSAGRAGAVGCWLDLSPKRLLSLSRQLYGHAPAAVLVTVSVGAAEIGEVLSPPVRAAVPVAVEAVRRVVASWRLCLACDKTKVLYA